MAEKSIAIIGAGLSAGCYARMNGYETKIFEMHDIPLPARGQISSFDFCCSATRDAMRLIVE